MTLPLKACAPFVIFIYIFFCLNVFNFFQSLYKELLEPTFAVLDNSCKVFRCSVTIDFISVMLGSSKCFG